MAYTIDPVPTIYNGVRMDSGLESGFAMWCDRNAVEWEYHPDALASEWGRWRPDFMLKDVCVVGVGDTPMAFVRKLYVECKPEGWVERAGQPVHEGLLYRMCACASFVMLATPDLMFLRLNDEAGRAKWIRRADGGVALAWPIRQPWAGKWWEGE